MASPEDYTHGPIKWDRNKFLIVLAVMLASVIAAGFALKASEPDPPKPAACYDTPRTEFDGGEPSAVICEEGK